MDKGEYVLDEKLIIYSLVTYIFVYKILYRIIIEYVIYLYLLLKFYKWSLTFHHMDVIKSIKTLHYEKQ